MRPPYLVSQSDLTITLTGFLSAVGQIIILRELLVLFYGNELSSGLIFAAWLLWNGFGSAISVRWAIRKTVRTETLGILLTLSAAALPMSILLIRASRVIWHLPVGELPDIGRMLLLSFFSTGLFCPLTGALFGLCWAFQFQKNGNRQPLGIYLGEAIGAGLGGLLFYFLFLQYFSVITTAWITAGLCLAPAGRILFFSRARKKAAFGRLIWGVVCLCALLMTGFGYRLDRWSRTLQWGSGLLSVQDTPFQNLALVRKDKQVSIFGSGLWLFSVPDRLSTESCVHLALIQHPNPTSVLLLGGGIAGLLEEMLSYPGIQRIDYVEPDPALIPFVEPYLPRETVLPLLAPKVHLFNQDPRTFLQRTLRTYDAVLMNTGDPITTQMNRFYTEEFFRYIKSRLAPDGIFSFALSGGEDILGPNQARFLGSIYKTVRRVFPDVMIYPGDVTRFVTANQPEELVSDYRLLTDRLLRRKLHLGYIREDILTDILNPFRLDYIYSMLAEIDGARVNRDFFPVCYFQSLMLWATQWHPMLQKLMSALARVRIRWVEMGILCVGVLLVSLFWIRRSLFRSAVGMSVFTIGGVAMAIQIILLLAFQIIEGFVYRQLTLIIAFFMTGLAAGTGWVQWRRISVAKSARPLFIATQTLICLYILALMLLLPAIREVLYPILSPMAMGWLFSASSLCAGILGGIHFSLAVTLAASLDASPGGIGGRLYAMDLAGAAGGALVVACLMLPVYGILDTLKLLFLLSAISLTTLLRGP